MLEIYSHSSGGCKSQIKVAQASGLFPSEDCEGESVLRLSSSFWWLGGNLVLHGV